MKIRRKILAVFSVVCLMMVLFQATAFAGDENTVYIDRSVQNGDGSKDSPVNNLEDALRLAGDNGTIVVMNYIPIEEDTVLENVTFIRGEGYKKHIFQVSVPQGKSSAELVLKNVTIDGNKENVSIGNENGKLIYVLGKNASLIIEDGSKIINNDSAGIFVSGGSVTMKGGEISGNTGYGAYGGGVHIFHGSTFTLDGGTIKNNVAENYDGAGVVIEASSSTDIEDMAKFYMNGGFIENNEAPNGCCGGILNFGYAELNGGNIKGNTSSWGAGIASVGNAKTILDGTKITENECSGNGAGVY